MRKFPLCFGFVLLMKLIGDDPEFQALRARNEARLAALKKANRLTEDRNVKPIASGSSADSYYLAQQQCSNSNAGAQLAAIRNTYPDYAYFAGIDWGDRPLSDFLGRG